MNRRALTRHRSRRREKATIAALALAVVMTGCAKDEAQSAVATQNPQSAAQIQVASSSISADSASQPRSAASPYTVKVYKEPGCECCDNWVQHLKEHGFTVETMEMPDRSMLKQKYAMGPELESCHTAVVGNYAIEGHVPADLIQKLLKEKPAIAGLAVPGMPTGSPGMEGSPKERYDVLTFDRAGRTTVYARR